MAAKKKRETKVKVIVIAEYGFSYEGKDYDRGDTAKFGHKDAVRLHKLGLVNPI